MATLLQKTEDPRQAYIIDKIEELKIRFPVAEIAKKTGINKSNISEMLNGKRPLSENVFKKFCDAYGLDGSYGFVDKNDVRNWEKAAIKALSWKLAYALEKISVLMGEPRDSRDFLAEIDESTNMILHGLRGSGES